MISFFKKKKNNLEEQFRIGDYDFSFDLENTTIEIEGNQIVDITIKANEGIFEQLCEQEDFEFNYGLYPPEFYARGVDLDKKRRITINESNQFDHEIALYFMEHNDVNIKLNIHDNWILIVGSVFINGKKYPLEIAIRK